MRVVYSSYALNEIISVLSRLLFDKKKNNDILGHYTLLDSISRVCWIRIIFRVDPH